MCELVKRGIAGAAICSEPFQQLGRTQAKVFGVPDLPLVIIPHPLGGLTLERVEGRAEHAVPQLAALIKGLRE
jgi:hypothetical protein